MKDLVIIGAGPAGITAAVYAARKKLDFAVISKDIGGQAAWSGDIENYTGYQFISGPELASKFAEHLKSFQFDMIEGIEASRIEKKQGGFKIILPDNREMEAKTVIVASGKRPRPLNVPGEDKYKNRGVTYCATCDGPLFANKDVVVVGGGNSALDAVLQMVRIAAKVYMVNITDKLTGDAVMQEKVKASAKVEILNGSRITEISGDQFVKKVKVETQEKTREIAVEGVFIEVGLIPNSGLIDFVGKNESGEIIVNCAAETSFAGIFAAGDVTNVPEKQIIVAAGEGAKAALSAFKYLSAH